MQTVSECGWVCVHDAVAHLLGALDPCEPLGVFECGLWALSERAQDGACLVLIVGYGLVQVLGACRRTLRGAPAPSGASPHEFWPAGSSEHTYYVKRVQKAGRI